MRYVRRFAKGVATSVAAFATMVMVAPAAFAYHGSAWTLQRGVPPSTGGTALGAWIIFGLLLVAAAYATMRMMMKRRAAPETSAGLGETTVAGSEPKAA